MGGEGRSGSGTPRRSKIRGGLAQALIEEDIPSGDLFTGGLVGVLLSDTEEAPEELEHRQQRQCLPVWNAVRLEDRKVPRPATLEKLEAEPALADAGLADNAYHLRVSADCSGERRIQSGHLVQTADEA
jgi:hypothetical protein